MNRPPNPDAEGGANQNPVPVAEGERGSGARAQAFWRIAIGTGAPGPWHEWHPAEEPSHHGLDQFGDYEVRDFIPLADAERREGELRQERDEARVFKWSVEDAVIEAVPERLAEIREWIDERGNEDGALDGLVELAHAPFDEPVAQTLDALSRAEAAEQREHEARTRLDELRRKWATEQSLREDKSGPNSQATYYATGAVAAIDEARAALVLEDGAE